MPMVRWRAGRATTFRVSDTLYVDHILEFTSAHGVNVDGVDLKDSKVSGAQATLSNSTPLVLGTTGQVTVATPTSDGSDTIGLAICSGGTYSSARGAYIWMFGNEHDSAQGDLMLTAGNVADGDILLATGGATRVKVDYDGSTAIGDGGTTNYTEFEADGTMEFNGAATVWDDVRVPLSTAKRIGNSDPDWEVFKNGVYALAFDASTDQEVMFSVQMPHGWKLGSSLNPHVHWAPSTTDTGSVTWKLEYTIANINGTFGNTVTLDVTDAGDGTAFKHQYADLGDISMSGYTASSDVSIMLMCRLYRDVDDGDDYADDAFALEVDFHYEIDTVGSRAEASK